MRHAETGFNLEVDLTRGNIERVPTDPQLTELHLGGLGTNAKLMWDRVGPEVEPFSPENLLVFGTGLLAGTPAPGCNRTIVSAISPQTKLMAFSMMGGFWGPELKHAGYDKVIFRGKSPELVYLWIDDDKVEILPADDLWGQSTMDAMAALLARSTPGSRAMAIGPAGENLVPIATVFADGDASCSGGMGAVMGAKRLKAITATGRETIPIEDKESFKVQRKWFTKLLKDHPMMGDVLPRLGTANLVLTTAGLITGAPSPLSAQATPDHGFVAAAGEQYRAGPLQRWILGRHYRDIWTTVIEVELLDLESVEQLVEALGSVVFTDSGEGSLLGPGLIPALALQKLGVPAAQQALRRALAHTALRVEAARALRVYGNITGVGEMERHLRSEGPETRLTAAAAIVILTTQSRAEAP